MAAPASTKLPTSPWWRDPVWWVRAVLTYALAAASGFGAARLGVPLPWMLGPFFVVGALSALGAPLTFIPMGRELAQVAVGLAVGLRFTAATLVSTLALLPAMVAATVFVMAYTVVAAFILRPLAGVDRVTAFFATAAAGVADMAVVADQKGGDPASVAIVHALRVSATVAIVPVVVVTFGAEGVSEARETGVGAGLLWLALALVAGFGVALLLRPTPIPNAWLVGPMFLGLAIGASGFVVVVPWIVIIVAQVALGTWLGCRFRREVLTAIPRVAAAGLAISLFMIACAGGGAFVLAAWTSLDVSTAFLALAPAAVTEMVITAKIMHLDAEIVTAFHVMRIAIVASTILAVFKLYDFITGGAHGPRI